MNHHSQTSVSEFTDSTAELSTVSVMTDAR
jgi:hypothetical protein